MRTPLPQTLCLLLGLTGCKVGLEPFAPDALLDDEEEADVDSDTDGDSDADSDSDSDGDTDADTDADAISIDSITPGEGLNTGGTRVTITGGPFDSSAQAYFGGELSNRVGFGSTELIVETPAYSSSGAVDVLVESDAGTGRSIGGFVYNEDASGKAGAIGEVSWTEGVGGYWGGSPPSGFGGGDVYFIEAADVHWYEAYVSSLDQCVNLFTTGGTLPSNPIDPSQSSISLVSTTSRTITLPWDSSYGAYSGDISVAADYVRNGNYTLGDMSDSYVPTGEVSNFLKGATDLTVTNPNITGSATPRITRTQSFQWNSSVTADWISIQLLLLNSAGTDFDDAIFCFARNDGNFAIPSAAWTTWPTNRQVNIIIGASVEPTGTFTHNGAESRVAGTYYLFGAAFTN